MTETPQSSVRISRRSIAKGAAWAAPVVIASQTAAFASASTPVPWPNCDPIFVDQKQVTSQTNDGNEQGNFKFIVPTLTEFPETKWTVKIIPIANDAGKVIKTKRKDFQIKDLVGAGSTLYQSFERNNVTGPTYDSETGVETITFTTPYTQVTRGNGKEKVDTSIGFRVWLGGPLSNWGTLSSDRGDKLVVTAEANGKQVVNYDSIASATPDKGVGYDGRL